MRRRRVSAGVGLAALGLFLLLVPVASTTAWDGPLRTDRSAIISVPSSASITGAPVEVDLYSGLPSPPCYGYGFCPVRYYLLPHYLTVVDCGTADCSPGTGTTVGTTASLPSNLGYYFWGLPGHVYRIMVTSWITFGLTNQSFPLTVVIVSPWLSGAPGVVALVGAAVAVVTGVRAPELPRPRKVPSAVA